MGAIAGAAIGLIIGVIYVLTKKKEK